jgi:hypothetical protein
MLDLFGDEYPSQAPTVQRKKANAIAVTAAALDPAHQAWPRRYPMIFAL